MALCDMASRALQRPQRLAFRSEPYPAAFAAAPARLAIAPVALVGCAHQAQRPPPTSFGSTRTKLATTPRQACRVHPQGLRTQANRIRWLADEAHNHPPSGLLGPPTGEGLRTQANRIRWLADEARNHTRQARGVHLQGLRTQANRIRWLADEARNHARQACWVHPKGLMTPPTRFVSLLTNLAAAPLTLDGSIRQGSRPGLSVPRIASRRVTSSSIAARLSATSRVARTCTATQNAVAAIPRETAPRADGSAP
jgi:hypothetical protein